MPELFPDTTTLVLCCLIIAGAQLIYATAGFGAGLFAVVLLAMVVPDLRGAIATLYVLTLLTEIWVLVHSWRQAQVRLLIALLPTTALGLWVGSKLLAAGDGDEVWLKSLLGVVVFLAGAWFMFEQRRRRNEVHEPDATPNEQAPSAAKRFGVAPRVVVGLFAGTLGGLFGTAGPPVVVLLRGYRLDKGAFRATLLLYFLLMSVLRGGIYLNEGILTRHEITAALWLLPASILGTLLGMIVHRRISERHFASGISILLVILGLMLLISGGR